MACQQKYHQIEIDGFAPSVVFSASGRHLLVNWEEKGQEERNCAVYEVGSWEKLAELRASGGCVAMCADEEVVLMRERSAEGKPFDMVLRRLGDGDELARYHMPIYWWPRVIECARESNLIWLDIDPEKIVAFDGSSGELVREYVADDLDTEYGGFTKYSPFEVLQASDRLIWVDQYAAVLWVYRLSTGELLSRIDVWPDEYGGAFGQDYELMGGERLAFGLTGRKEGVTGAYLVVVDLASPSRESEFYLGNYDLHGLVVMEPGDNRVLYFIHEQNASCGLVGMTDVASGEQKVAIDLCSASRDNQFDAQPVTAEDVLLVHEWRNYFIYSYPDFKVVKTVEPAYSYSVNKYSPLRLSFQAVASSSRVGIFDWRELDYVDEFVACSPISDYVKVDPSGRWVAAVCEGVSRNPTVSAVALVDLRRYVKDAPECEDRSYLQCGTDGSVHWYDSCGNDQGVALECEEAHSTGCENLSAHHAACVCAGNWDPHFGCRVCRGHLDPATDCTECQPHWSDVANDCLTCPGNWDVLQNCGACVGNWDEGQDCLGCRGHWDPATGCTECLPHWRDAGDDCGGCSSNWDIGQECNACLPGWYGDDCQFWYCDGEAVAEGRFAEPVVYEPTRYWGSLVVADFDEDGVLDMAIQGVEDLHSNFVEVFMGTGDFSSVPQRLLAPASKLPITGQLGKIVSKDFNGDGHLDLVVSNAELGEVVLFTGTGWGGFVEGGSFSACTDVSPMAAADIDGDGNEDLVVGCREDDQLNVYWGAGDGTFHYAGSYPAGDMPHDMIGGDFNTDGILDVVVVNGNGPGFSVLMGGGNGNVGDGSFATPVFHDLGGCGKNTVATADFDGDGDLDLAAVCDKVNIYLNDGTGSFSWTTSFAVPGIADSLATSDFDNDGIQDLVVGESYYSTVVFLKGNGQGAVGDGTFTVMDSFPAGGNPKYIVTGDMNNDGITDLLAVNYQPDNMVVLLGAGQCR